MDLKDLDIRLEKRLARAIVDSQWEAILEALQEEFKDAELDLALRAGRIACERMIEHML